MGHERRRARSFSNIRTRKLDETVRFYQDILGLEKGAGRISPSGAWMYSEGKRWCIWSISPRPTSRKSRIPGSSIVASQPGVCRHEAGLENQGDGIRLRQVRWRSWRYRQMHHGLPSLYIHAPGKAKFGRGLLQAQNVLVERTVCRASGSGCLK